MQSGFTRSSLPRATYLTALMLCLSACDNGNAAGAAAESPAASAPGGPQARNYVLVMQTRPEVPQQSFPHERALYKTCAAVAGMAKRAVKPFPELPSDLVRERRTYASDGERSMVRKVSYYLDTRKVEVENGCELRLVSRYETTVISKGVERSAGQEEDGEVHHGEPVPASEEPVRASLLASYSAPKRVSGVPLKCNPENICIVDPAVALVAEGSRPVQAAHRIDDPRTYGTALVTEPVSLTVGKPVDPALFSLAAGE